MLQSAFAQDRPAVSLTDELDLTTIPGIGPKTAADLAAAGFTTLQSLIDATPEDLQQLDGVGPKTAQSILNWANERAAQAGEGTEEAGGEGDEEALAAPPIPASQATAMNDQDFLAALSRAFKESEERAKAIEATADEAQKERDAERED